jgi:hypothetical protein
MAKMRAGLSLGGTAEKQARPLNEIMSEDSRCGVAEIDRFTTEFDPEANDGKGAYVKRPNVSAELAIELVCNEGKGYGSQTVSRDDLPEAIAALKGIVEADFERPEGDDSDWQPPGVVIENSWRMVHPRRTVRKDGKLVSERDTSQPKDFVSFRTRNGRGAKPVEVHRSQLHQVIGLLENIPDFLDQHDEALWDDYRSVKQAEREAAEREAEAKRQAEAAAAGESTE